MTNVGNSFGLPFRDPEWFSKFLVTGLIFLIPIVGWINLTGWMLATLDNYRQGRVELPPAGFHYIGRGANVFVVGLLYALAIAAVLLVPMGLVVLAAMGSQLSTPAAPYAGAPPSAFGALAPLWGGGGMLVGIVGYIFMPAVIINTERGGIGGGLNVGAVWQMAAASWKNSLVAGLLIYAAYFIGGFGIYACCVGIIVSYPYATAVVAGILRYYEASFEATPYVAPTAGPPTTAV
ncbi:MAG: DUF4013 domain-containing protein [Candidatus Dormibacteraeota bacterium]|nr:DUF4013 domain-containing protein [Candidatus Dormibacteraeota bacterium]